MLVAMEGVLVGSRGVSSGRRRRHGPEYDKSPLFTGFCRVLSRLDLRGPDQSRTDDGGFAIRCLSHLATGPVVASLLTIKNLRAMIYCWH